MKDKRSYCKILSSSRHVAHQAANANQLCFQLFADQVEIWIIFLMIDIHGASCSSASIRGGGTELRKSMRYMFSDDMDRGEVNHMTMTLTPNVEDRHRVLLRRLSAASSFVFGLVIVAACCLPLFDASPFLVPDAASPLLRWDVFHFLHVARSGYVYEHEWAFLPAAPWIIRYTLVLIGQNVVISHYIFAASISVLASETVQTMYTLSLHHLRSPHQAFLASALALLPSSPATFFFVPYNEPFFTFLTYRGALGHLKSKFIQ